jgi:hypothetical protein
MSRIRGIVALTLLAGCSGCVMVQARYTVFGFDAWQTESPEQARTISLILLAGVSVVSAVIGATIPGLLRRWRASRERERPEFSNAGTPVADAPGSPVR